MLQTSLLLMKRLYKTETPIFRSVVCSLFPKAIFLTFVSCNPASRKRTLFTLIGQIGLSKQCRFRSGGTSVQSTLFVTHLAVFRLTLVLLNPDIPCLCKQCRSRSVGFWRSQLILPLSMWIYINNLDQVIWLAKN